MFFTLIPQLASCLDNSTGSVASADHSFGEIFKFSRYRPWNFGKTLVYHWTSFSFLQVYTILLGWLWNKLNTNLCLSLLTILFERKPIYSWKRSRRYSICQGLSKRASGTINNINVLTCQGLNQGPPAQFCPFGHCCIPYFWCEATFILLHASNVSSC